MLERWITVKKQDTGSPAHPPHRAFPLHLVMRNAPVAGNTDQICSVSWVSLFYSICGVKNVTTVLQHCLTRKKFSHSPPPSYLLYQTHCGTCVSDALVMLIQRPEVNFLLELGNMPWWFKCFSVRADFHTVQETGGDKGHRKCYPKGIILI